MKYKSYKHTDIQEAKNLFKRDQKLLVHTINWTYATSHRKGSKKVYYNKVHYNVYTTTLPKLIKWIRETEEVTEDIFRIELKN